MLEPDVLDYYSGLFERFGEMVSESCWSVIQPDAGTLTIAALLQAWGGGARTPEMAPLADVWQEGGIVAVIEQDGAVLVVEPGGFELTRAEVLRKLTPDGRAHVGWLAFDGRVSITGAYYGEVVASWEFTLGPESQAHIFREFAQQAGQLDESRLPEAVFAGVEALSGVRLRAEHLTQPVPILRGAPVVESEARLSPKPPPGFAMYDAEVAYLLGQQPEAVQDAEVGRLVVRMIQHMDLDRPDVMELARLLDVPGEALPMTRPEIADRLQRELSPTPEQLMEATPEAEHASLRLAAFRALLSAIYGRRPGPGGRRRTRPLGALVNATVIFGDAWEDERRTLIERYRIPPR